MLNVQKPKHRTIEVDGVQLFYREAGRRHAPGLLLLHGQPSSSYSFRDVISPLAEVARVVAPDLPGFGFTEAPDDYEYTFETMARTIDALTREIGMQRFYLYIHDFGAPVAFSLALARPDRVLGLIIQNGNAHEEGFGPDWDANKAYWAEPTPENRGALPEWLNPEGVRHLCRRYPGSTQAGVRAGGLASRLGADEPAGACRNSVPHLRRLRPLRRSLPGDLGLPP